LKSSEPSLSQLDADDHHVSGRKHSARRPPETQLRRRLRDLAYRRRRFGYRRLYILLRNEGEASSVNRI